jgi:hypothetical protein
MYLANEDFEPFVVENSAIFAGMPPLFTQGKHRRSRLGG